MRKPKKDYVAYNKRSASNSKNVNIPKKNGLTQVTPKRSNSKTIGQRIAQTTNKRSEI